MSYAALMDEDYKHVFDYMEKPKTVSVLLNSTDTDKRIETEYNWLEKLTREHTETQVPGTRIIGASFVKTPFHEMSPLPESNTTGQIFNSSPFGLMIASEGFTIKDDLLEFWNMVVH